MNAIATRQNTSYSLEPTSFGEALQFAKMIADSDLAPKDFRNKPTNVLVAIQMGREVGLSPMQALQNIAVVNGRPAIWGDAALALVKASGLCDDVIERMEGEGDNAVAICIAKRKGAAPVERRFSVADARAAGLLGKQGPWTQYRSRMQQMRARGFAIRDAFPDVLRGLITHEEAQDIPVEPRNITPATPRPTMATIAAEPISLERQGYDAAERGTEALKAWFLALSKPERMAVVKYKDDTLKAVAADADKAIEDADRALDNAAAAEARGLADEPEPDELTTLIEPTQPDLSLIDDGASAEAIEMADGHARWIRDRRTAQEIEAYYAREDVAAYRAAYPLLGARMTAARDARLRQMAAAN